MKKQISINVRDTGLSIPLEELHEIQGNLKEMSAVDAGKVKNSFVEHGIDFIFHVWNEFRGTKSKPKWWIIDGHGRKKMAVAMISEGFTFPPFPCVETFASNMKEAKEKILRSSSTYHKLTPEGLYEFIEKEQIKVEQLKEYALPEINIKRFEEEYYGDPVGSELYTKTIVAPIYEPKKPKPKVEELFDSTKAEQLIKKIESSSIPEKEKIFLKQAAYRHVVFDYQNIAEYYAHSPKEVQQLMEKSALVIIDFDKAIENGFVALSDEFAANYKTA